MEKLVIQTHSKNETIKLGSVISTFLKKGDVILLTGDLGAGKTTFTQGIAQGLGIRDKIISPTFNILKCYFNNNINLFHIDAYRLEDNKSDIGLEEFIEGNGVCVIEWPHYIDYLLPKESLEIKIENTGEDNRTITISSSNKYDEDVKNLRSTYVHIVA